MKKEFNLLKSLILLLILLDVVIWYFILFPKSLSDFELYFLKVGQGDASMALLTDENHTGFIKVLIDGGPANGNLALNLEKILGSDRYIDLVFISHPQTDHFGGLIEIFKNYRIGGVFYNGEISSDSSWKALESLINIKKIPKIAILRDEMVNYGFNTIKALNSANFGPNTNNSALVLLLNSNGIKTLFTGDIDAATEVLISKSEDIGADILKVSHHGSKYSSDLDFLKKVNPKVSVIEVGKNSYGHPAKEVLDKLNLISSKIFNTYDQGLIKIIREGNDLKVFSYPNP